jgi:uncharacterized membrane-anchored protein
MRMELGQIGRVLLLFGIVLAGVGLFLVFAERLPGIGRLPGDITLRGDGWTIYAPLATAIVLSILLTAALNLVVWLRR